jgi:hypothetical protein
MLVKARFEMIRLKSEHARWRKLFEEVYQVSN